jgi:hypothetical protein
VNCQRRHKTAPALQPRKSGSRVRHPSRCRNPRSEACPVNPIIEPIERSNSPATINRHAPTATIAYCADTSTQFITPCSENLPELDAATRKNTKTATVLIIAPSSGRISDLRNDDILRTRCSAPSQWAACILLSWTPPAGGFLNQADGRSAIAADRIATPVFTNHLSRDQISSRLARPGEGRKR